MWNALNELARVLTPGGRLLLSTPNYTHLTFRLRYLFVADLGKLGRGDNRVCNPNFHHSPLPWPRLKFYLEHAGFVVEHVRTINKRRRRFLYLPVVWLIRGITLLWKPRSRRILLTDDATNPELMAGGNTLFVQARRG